MLSSFQFSSQIFQWIVIWGLRWKFMENIILGPINIFLVYWLRGKQIFVTPTSNEFKNTRKASLTSNILKKVGKNISESLGFQQTKVRDYLKNERKKKPQKNMDRWWTSGRRATPPKLLQEPIDDLSRRQHKNSEDKKHSRPNLSKVRAVFNNKKETPQEWHHFEANKTKATAYKKETNAGLPLTKNIVMIPKTFENLFSGLMRQMWNFLRGVGLNKLM